MNTASPAAQTSPGPSGTAEASSKASSSSSKTSLTTYNPTATALPPQTTSSLHDPSTNDQSTTIGVPAWFYWGQNGDEIGALLNRYNARITEIRVDDPLVPTFTVSMIQNTGIYGSAW